jgi:hypothetical protein
MCEAVRVWWDREDELDQSMRSTSPRASIARDGASLSLHTTRRHVRNNVSLDWTVKDSLRAKLRVIVECILREHGYPPDKQESAADTVLEQRRGWRRRSRASASD